MSRFQNGGIIVAFGVLLWASAAWAAGPDISFLDQEGAKAAILDDSLEPYFDQLQPMEMATKTGSPVEGVDLAQQRTECRRRYEAGALAFTEKEKEALAWCVNQLHPFLVRDYPAYAAMTWSFLKLSDQIEGGLPHTRGKHIVVPANLCEAVCIVRQLPPEKMEHLVILEILVHEQMHVFQRTHPGRLDSLYTGLWGFQKAKAITGNAWLVEHHLANPDGVDCPWVLPVKGQTTTYLWPLVVLSDGNGPKKMPADFRMLAISLDQVGDGFRVQSDPSGSPVASDLMSVEAFTKIMPMTHNLYHPNEAAADLFAKMVIFDSFVPKSSAPQAAKVEASLAPLRKWFKSNLGTQTVQSSGRDATPWRPYLFGPRGARSLPGQDQKPLRPSA